MCRAFDHDDGIVNDDADRQHDREQRRQVDGEPECGHACESADDGHGDRGHGHQHGAPILQEHHDHDQNQDRRLEQRLPYLVDGSADERRRIERNAVGQPLRKALRELGHFGADRAGHVQRVRLQRLINADARRRLAVERENLAVDLGAKLDARNVSQIRHLPVAFGLDDDVLELTDVVEASRNVESILERLGARCRRHAELAGGHLLVLALERIDDILGGERARV